MSPGLTKQVLSTQNALVHIMAFTYLLYSVCIMQKCSFIEFTMNICIYDDILYAIQITDKVITFKLSKLHRSNFARSYIVVKLLTATKCTHGFIVTN